MQQQVPRAYARIITWQGVRDAGLEARVSWLMNDTGIRYPSAYLRATNVHENYT